MKSKIYVFDPTASDKQSAVRGIGRYLQILRENFSDEFEFVSGFTNFKDFMNFKNSVFINPFFNFLQPPLILKRIAKKQIAIIHDLIPLKYPSHFPPGIKGSIYILLNKLALKNYDLIITDSEASKGDIVNILHLEESRIKVIYPCLPKRFDKLSASHYSLATSNYCIYVGDATWNKNLVTLARAIKIANINCVMVGKVFSRSHVETFQRSNVVHSWQKELREFIELTKNDKRFIFPGFVPDSELIKLYQQSSINILPSRDEGFGFSYVEASQFACPSLLSDIPILREISDGKAIFFDPNNPQEIANKINEINSNKTLRNKIGTDAKKRSEFFSREKFKLNFSNVV